MRIRTVSFLLLFAFFLFPQMLFAAVRINEIAWMGTAVSGTDEWIELANTSDASVSLSGWRIEAEDGSPSIALSGVIAPNGFFLIERTDDTTVPEVSADLVVAFGSGLGNTGETLRLRDESGVIIDTVFGGTDWSNIGGDNVTKETPQRQSGTSWATGAPTPRAMNISPGTVRGASTTESSGAAQTTTTSTTASSSVASKPAYSATVYPREKITVSAGADARAFVRLPLSFVGHTLGLYDEALPYASYRWNFGDGATGVGNRVTHEYRFPGTYTVTLHVRHLDLEETDRLLVVVTETPVVVTRALPGENGFAEISNEGDLEVDISGWVLASISTSTRFVFPEHTVISAHRSVLFPNTVTGISEGQEELLLHFANGSSVGAASPATLPVIVATASSRPVSAIVRTTSAPSSSASSVHTRGVSVPDLPSSVGRLSVVTPSDGAVMGASVASGSAAATVLWEREGKTPFTLGDQLSGGMRWFLVLFGMLLLAVAGVVIMRSRVDQPSSADEYAIIEDIIDDGGEEIDLSRRS